MVVTWALIEASSVLFPALLLPDWTLSLVVILALLGFPAVLILAWVFDITPEGIQTTSKSEQSPQPPLLVEDSGAPDLISDNRLDGWKRIANTLNRDVRTVRRWEKHQGLPVHRVQHNKGATVYAYRSELKTWLIQRGQAPKQDELISREPYRLVAKPWFLGGGAALATLLTAAYFWTTHAPRSIEFNEQDWVLITQFENRTGEEVLDGTLEYALQRELNNSRWVKVVPQNRINDALSLMELGPDTAIDLEIGRQISLRDGSIRIMVDGRVTRVGEQYSLSVNLVNPADGVTLSGLEVNARSQSDILSAIQRLASKTRKELGEELVGNEDGSDPLSRVTTPSLQALRLYSKADFLMSSGTSRALALPILQQALLTDPEFASAHVMLYYLYLDRDERIMAQQHLAQARELADTVSERERLFIISTDHTSRPEEIEQGIDILEILAGIYPDHFWAVSNLASLNQVLGRYDQVYRWRAHRADLRPNAGWSNLEAALAATVFRDIERREPYLERVQQLAEENSWLKSRLEMLPFYEAWLSGDRQAAADQLNRFRTGLGTDKLTSNPNIADFLRSGYLALGMLQEYQQIPLPNGAPDWLEAIHQADIGNTEPLQDYLWNARGHMWDATLMAWANRPEEAQAMIDNPLPAGQAGWPYFRPNFNYLAKGELALTLGKSDIAVDELTYGLHLLNVFSIAHYLFGKNALARAHIQNGDLPGAIETLESTVVEKPWTIFEPGATYLWMRNQKFLARLYGQSGDKEKAAEIKTELMAMLQPGN